MARKPTRRRRVHRKAGRPPKLSPELLVQFKQLALANQVSVMDLTILFGDKTGVSISRASAHKYLKAAGLQRARAIQVNKAASGPAVLAGETEQKRFGYTEAHRRQAVGGGYPTSLTDAEWALVADLFQYSGPGRPPTVSRRAVLDACIYVVRTGCAWRLLPKEFPAWESVYAHFRRWTAKGLFEEMNDRLRRMWREREHRAPEPTGAVIDTQSVKSTPQGGPSGYDAGKKIKGRKRHIVTDTLGLLLAVVVHSAGVQDRDGAADVVAQAKAKCPTIKRLYADSGYNGQCARDLEAKHGIVVDIVRHPADRAVPPWQDPNESTPPPVRGFKVLPKRWVVERTHAWNDHCRRLSKEYDRRPDVSCSWVWLVQATLVMRRIAWAEGAAARV